MSAERSPGAEGVSTLSVPRRPIVGAHHLSVTDAAGIDGLIDVVSHLRDLGVSHVLLTPDPLSVSLRDRSQAPVSAADLTGGAAALRRLSSTGVGILTALDVSRGVVAESVTELRSLTDDGAIDGVVAHPPPRSADRDSSLRTLEAAGLGPLWVTAPANDSASDVTEPAGALDLHVTDLIAEIHVDPEGAEVLAELEGGRDPSIAGPSPVDRLHAANLERTGHTPPALVATSVPHDGCSVVRRARCAVLTQHAGWWREQVTAWMRQIEPHRDSGGPDVAGWHRVLRSMVIGWPTLAPEEGPDDSAAADESQLSRRLLEDRSLLESLIPAARLLAAAGVPATVSQTALALTSPGAPVICHGHEMSASSPPPQTASADWSRRRRVLAELATGATPTPESATLAVTQLTLALRRRLPDAFAGAYRPLSAGPTVCAFTRGDDEVLVVVPLRARDTDRGLRVPVPAGRWVDRLSGPHPRAAPPATMGDLVGPWGVGLWERVD